MPTQPRNFFDHSLHKLKVYGVDALLDVLAFEGTEALSQPFNYQVEFTCADGDIGAETMLGKSARFSLFGSAQPLPIRGLNLPPIKPLRVLNGVITGFKRLSGSSDEARYEVTLEPHLALLRPGQQYRIYQHESVPQIVEGILRSRHDFEGQDFFFNLVREYPRREQVMQYGESDLAFISRLLADVGIWYRFTRDERLDIDVVEFHDDQRHYQFDVGLAYRPPSGLSSSGQDAVWGLQSSHQVVEQHVNIRSYHHRVANAFLNGDIDQTRGASGTWGEAYHYAEAYTELGDPYAYDEDLLSESGFFYGRLRHERYLNGQTRLSGISSSATLTPGQVLKISGGAPQAFAPGAVITRLTTRAARDRSVVVSFEAIPYSETVCFRPALQPKPQIAGTVPARVTSPQEHDPYGHIDMQGRYKVNFLFDRDNWKRGEESLWLRLARPYAGDTHGLHLPLIPGTEVAIAFEQGDPDRPYIAHALHDSEHPDHVTLARRDFTRNVLRTPANNTLRMEDQRGQEHVKLSTEYAGKSQLNLGHLVDAKKQKRGEGFELRTDGWGAIRGGKGVFISADGQPKAQGQTLEMDAVLGRLEQAGEQLQSLSTDAQAANAEPADVQAQLNLLKQDLEQLKASVLLLSAPQGIALTSGKHLQLAAQNNLMLNAGAEANISVVKRLFIGVGQGLSMFVRKLGIKLIANQGPVSIHAQNDTLELIARHGLEITSTEDEIRIVAKKKITLNAGGSYITLDACCIESGTLGDYNVKSANFDFFPSKATLPAKLPTLPALVDPPLMFNEQFQIFASDGEQALAGSRYVITGESGQKWKGVTDNQGFTQRVSTSTPEKLSLKYDLEEEEGEELSEGITLRLGLFFDGTGNNQGNSAATEQCRREDLQLFDPSELESIIQVCKAYGFDKFGGAGFASSPDSSYGNAPSNVVHLYDLYPDDTATPIAAEAKIGYLSIYLEGIGTSSNGRDELLGMALGRGETGVVARVEQVPSWIKVQLDLFQQTNPDITIRRIEFDIFGFSRGGAAARHCANELLKPGRGLFSEILKSGSFGLSPSFDPGVDISLNLIGLFDTVAAIAAPELGDFTVSDDHNPGVNLYLPPGCARQVIQLRAGDEYRNNFALNSVQSGHREITLPGAHSDIGGGYPNRGHERLWLTKPRKVSVKIGRSVETSEEWFAACAHAHTLRANGLADDGNIEVMAWKTATAQRGKADLTHQDYWMVTVLDRPVRGELALISLRLMRELGVGHGVPFKSLEAQPSLALPEDLKPLAARILEQTLVGTEIGLSTAQAHLLRRRYIHQSAHWTPRAGVMVNKPAQDNTRNVYPNTPQKGYPQ
jgi:type VI secretion system secreted protein VgrG